MLAGGWDRAGDVLILEALAAGDAAVLENFIMVDGRATDRAALLRDLAGTLDGVRQRLADRGLILRRTRRLLFRWVGAAAMAPVIGLGLVKLAIGLGRDKPVGVLLFLLVVTSIGTVVVFNRRPTTLAGRRAVHVYRQENDRAIRAPRSNEILPAFACLGAAALVCSDFSDYGKLLKASGSGGDGGGGCGGGGGGCGGCGS